MAEVNPSATRWTKDPILTHPVVFACIVAALWALSGMVGREPWREEAQPFGVAYEMLQSGDWVVPTLAGEPYVRNPPLASMSAALLVTLLQPAVPAHDAARLATGFYVVLMLLAMAAAGRELLGAGRGWLTSLALLGSVGLLLPSHFLTPEVHQLAGIALALYGWALGLRRPAAGGLALGTGLGIAFLAKGFFGPLCLLVTAFALPVLGRDWRNRRYAWTLLVAAAAALPWLAAWPVLFAQRAPELFQAWFWTDNVGRLFGNDPPWPPERPGFYLAILPWFAFPVLPLALWGLWVERRKLREPRLLLPVVLTVVLLGLLSVSDTSREALALPLLLPLSLLAVIGLLQLPRSPANAFWWFSILFTTVMVLMAWFEWTALELGFPEARHRHWLELQPGYVPRIDAFVVVASLALSAGWGWLVARLRRSPERPLVAWTAGVAVIWALAATMFMGYVDADKTYRKVMTSIAQALPAGYDCLSSYNVADAQRALLHYYTGIRTFREGVPGRGRFCQVLLVQGARANMYVPGPEWVQIWEGARRGERRELFRLYRRA
jgi:4-amino-4-deoxy-L-arabinose transferase-like glycosyltransferase